MRKTKSLLEPKRVNHGHNILPHVSRQQAGSTKPLFNDMWFTVFWDTLYNCGFTEESGKGSGNVVKSIKRMSAPVPLNGRYQFSLSSSSLKDFCNIFLRSFFWQKFITWMQQSIVANPAAIILIDRCLNLFSTY